MQTKEGKGYRKQPVLLLSATPVQILNQANDWEFLMDEEHNPIVFPPHIVETEKRPDIIIYSDSIKTVVLIELTVHIEQNLADANLRKKCKYSELVAECENRSWTTHYLLIAGAFIIHPCQNACQHLAYQRKRGRKSWTMQKRQLREEAMQYG